jgi:hypothetical protein
MSRAQHNAAADFLDAIVNAIDERLTARLTELVKAGETKPPPDPPFFDQPALAERLRVRPRTLEKWRQLGKGPPWRRVGKRAIYPSAGVARWLEAAEANSSDASTPATVRQRRAAAREVQREA